MTSSGQGMFNFSLTDNAVCLVGDWHLTPIVTWIICSCSGLVAYTCATMAAKALLQYCYAIPVLLSTPLTIAIFIGFCELSDNGGCSQYCYSDLVDMWITQHLWLVVLWWLSQYWIGSKVFLPAPQRLMASSSFYVRPLFDTSIVEQWLVYNYTRDSKEIKQAQHESEPPFLYFCITMWHENVLEMTTILKSIVRCDIDNCARKTVQSILGRHDPDFYEFEGKMKQFI